ncbi:hypothetical protein [Nocardia sp. IFM 10818]
MNETTPTLGKIRRITGIADQVLYEVPVAYPDEPTKVVSFVRRSPHGPIFMYLEPFGWCRIEDPNRFGDFGPEWVQRFFSED